MDLTSTHDGLTITGAGIGSTIFDQSGTGDHFMEIKSSATNITISDMTIKDYDESDNGGAIDITSGGTITLQDIHFDNNSTTSSYDNGGAVYINSSSTVTIDRSKFTNNESYNGSGAKGSCIYTEATTTTIQNCLFYDNICGSSSNNGHVYVDDGTTSLINCTFTENGAGSPVFFYSDDGNSHVVKNCIFHNNTAPMI